MQTDANQRGVGATLMQEGRPAAIASRASPQPNKDIATVYSVEELLLKPTTSPYKVYGRRAYPRLLPVFSEC